MPFFLFHYSAGRTTGTQKSILDRYAVCFKRCWAFHNFSAHTGCIGTVVKQQRCRRYIIPPLRASAVYKQVRGVYLHLRSWYQRFRTSQNLRTLCTLVGQNITSAPHLHLGICLECCAVPVPQKLSWTIYEPSVSCRELAVSKAQVSSMHTAWVQVSVIVIQG